LLRGGLRGRRGGRGGLRGRRGAPGRRRRGRSGRGRVRAASGRRGATGRSRVAAGRFLFLLGRAVPPVDLAGSGRVVTDAIELAALVVIPLVDLAVVVRVLLDPDQLAVLVVLPQVDALIEVHVELVAYALARVVVDGEVELAVEVAVDLLEHDLRALVVVVGDHVDLAVHVQIDLLAGQHLGLLAADVDGLEVLPDVGLLVAVQVGRDDVLVAVVAFFAVDQRRSGRVGRGRHHLGVFGAGPTAGEGGRNHEKHTRLGHEHGCYRRAERPIHQVRWTGAARRTPRHP